jgi:hypothetical protein
VKARTDQGWLDKSIPAARPNTTPTPSKKNQGVKRNATDPLITVVTKSCMPPETTNVIMSAIVAGKIRRNGEYTYFPNP